MARAKKGRTQQSGQTAPSGRQTSSKLQTRKGVRPFGTFYNPGSWYTQNYDFVIDVLGPSASGVRHITFQSTGLSGILATAGEYRFLSVRCEFNPVTSSATDRVAIAPYIDNSAQLLKPFNFTANRRPLRKGDSIFVESLNVASQIFTVNSAANPIPLIGGISLFHTDKKLNSSFGFINVTVVYQVRGKKTDAATFEAK